MFRTLALTAGLLAAASAAIPAQAAERVRIEGELIDTWCSVTGIMFAYGTAHHQCAVWCAVGGIPVSIKDEADNTYMVLKIEGDDRSVANPRLVTIQSHAVTVEGDLIERDGVRYLIVDTVADDKGIVNLTHDDYGVVPFGE